MSSKVEGAAPATATAVETETEIHHSDPASITPGFSRDSDLEQLGPQNRLEGLAEDLLLDGIEEGSAVAAPDRPPAITIHSPEELNITSDSDAHQSLTELLDRGGHIVAEGSNVTLDLNGSRSDTFTIVNLEANEADADDLGTAAEELMFRETVRDLAQAWKEKSN